MHLYVPMWFLMISNKQPYNGCMADWFKSFDLPSGRQAWTFLYAVSRLLRSKIVPQNPKALLDCWKKRNETPNTNTHQGKLKMMARNNPKNIVKARLGKLELSFFL